MEPEAGGAGLARFWGASDGAARLGQGFGADPTKAPAPALASGQRRVVRWGDGFLERFYSGSKRPTILAPDHNSKAKPSTNCFACVRATRSFGNLNSSRRTAVPASVRK